MTDRQRPAEPAVDDKGRSQGGFAWIARQLNLRFPPAPSQRLISRQLVHKWWIKRTDNGFPKAIAVEGSANGGRGHHVFQLQDVVDWYVIYRKTRLRGGAPVTTEHATTPETPPGKTLISQQNRDEGPLAA